MQTMQTLKRGISNRRYPDRPLIGVGGIVFRDDHVLLVKRAREPSKNKWSIPGGLVKIGETLEMAIKREIYEETKVKVQVVDIVAILDRIIRDAQNKIEFHYVLIDFLCKPLSVNEPVRGDDSKDSRYVKLSDLHKFSLTRGTKDVIMQAFLKKENPIYFKL